MPFRFPLAAVLLVRENAEKREERKLQQILHEMVRIRYQVEQLDAEMANAHTVREQAMQRPIPAFQLHTFLSQVQSAAERKKPLIQRLRTLEKERDQQLKVYQAAHRDHETLIEILRKQREAYEQERARSQQKQLDDMFIARRHRS
jgi:flagellar export protein FliJ